jgi:hypothetical protein
MLVSCKQEDILLSERDKIIKYLEGRRIVAEEELADVIEEEPAFYQIFDRYAFRHIVNYYDADRETKPEVEWGDRLEIRFNAYTFTGSEPSSQSIYLSNVPEMIEQLGKKSGNTLLWSSEPLNIELGKTAILSGLEHTLPGCREADSVQIYMTSNHAYGKQLIGNVPKNSMIAWYIKIEKVTK